MTYTIIRDSREQAGKGWVFSKSELFDGTEIAKLGTGDYTIKGFEKQIVIERKGCVAEFCANLTQQRFVGDYVDGKDISKQSEFVRMETIPHTFIILEFNLEELLKYPYIKEIPSYRRKYIKFKGYAALGKINELMLKYKTKILFCGDKGQDVASSIFKRFLDKYAKIKN